MRKPKDGGTFWKRFAENHPNAPFSARILSRGGGTLPGGGTQTPITPGGTGGGGGGGAGMGGNSVGGSYALGKWRGR